MTKDDIELIKADIRTVINGAKKTERVSTGKAIWKLLNFAGYTEAAKYVEFVMKPENESLF